MQKLKKVSIRTGRFATRNKGPQIKSSALNSQILLILCLSLTLACSQSQKEPGNVQGHLETTQVQLLPQLSAALFESDRGGSYVGFQIMHLGLNKIRGDFSQFSGAVLYNPADPLKTSVTFKVDIESLNTRSGRRDRDLMSPRFFDQVKYPFATFQSTEAKRSNDNQLILFGDLTLKGITKRVQAHCRMTTPEVVIIPGRKDYMIHFEGSIIIDRNDFGITGGDFIPGIIADEAEIEFSMLARQQNYDAIHFNSDPLRSIGEVMNEHLAENSIEEAISLFQQMKKSEADNFNFRLFELEILARKLMHQQKYKEALSLFEFMTEQDQNYRRAFLKIGEIQCFLEQPSEALKAFKRVLEIDPVNIIATEMIRHLSTE